MLQLTQGLILIRNKDNNIIKAAYIDRQVKALIQGLTNVKIETVDNDVKVYNNSYIETRRIETWI